MPPAAPVPAIAALPQVKVADVPFGFSAPRPDPLVIAAVPFGAAPAKPPTPTIPLPAPPRLASPLVPMPPVQRHVSPVVPMLPLAAMPGVTLTLQPVTPAVPQAGGLTGEVASGPCKCELGRSRVHKCGAPVETPGVTPRGLPGHVRSSESYEREREEQI
jgi:hypothetical protein